MAKPKHQVETDATVAFLQEVDENMRIDRLTELWNTYKFYIFGGLAALFFSVAGYNYWVSSTESRLAKESEMFWTFTENKKADSAMETLKILSTTGDVGYSILARMQEAQLHQDAGNTEQAIATYKSVAEDSSVPTEYKELAAFYQAQLMVASDADGALAILEPLTNGVYAMSAWEVMGNIYENKGETVKAVDAYERVLEQPAQNIMGPRLRSEVRLEELRPNNQI